MHGPQSVFLSEKQWSVVHINDNENRRQLEIDCYGHKAFNENGYSSIINLALTTSVLPTGDIIRCFVKCLQKTRYTVFLH